MENLFASFDISSQGMKVQRMRLSATANNIANINTTSGPDGEPYKREVVIAREIPRTNFNSEFNNQINLLKTDKLHGTNISATPYPQTNQVLVAQTFKDTSPPRMVYDPNHPDANEQGYVLYPNINIVSEMVEMIIAQRAFQANTNVVQAAKNIARDSLEI